MLWILKGIFKANICVLWGCIMTCIPFGVFKKTGRGDRQGTEWRVIAIYCQLQRYRSLAAASKLTWPGQSAAAMLSEQGWWPLFCCISWSIELGTKCAVPNMGLSMQQSCCVNVAEDCWPVFLCIRWSTQLSICYTHCLAGFRSLILQAQEYTTECRVVSFCVQSMS